MPKALRPEDAFADQIEWLSHRYDPGYFLGGTIRPELRVSLGARAKRVAGVFAFASGLGILGTLVAVSIAVGMALPDPWSLSVGVLSLLAGVKLWRTAGADSGTTRVDVGAEAKRLSQAASLTSLGAVIIALASIALVTLVAAVASLLRGQVGLPVGAGVLLAMWLLHRRRGSTK
jgi:hypothetical protein